MNNVFPFVRLEDIRLYVVDELEVRQVVIRDSNAMSCSKEMRGIAGNFADNQDS